MPLLQIWKNIFKLKKCDKNLKVMERSTPWSPPTSVPATTEVMATEDMEGHGGHGRATGCSANCTYCGRRVHWESDCYIRNIDNEIKAISMSQLRDMQQ